MTNEEQAERARRAQELGLLTMLKDDGRQDPQQMATALRQLTQQHRPSDIILPGLLDGLSNINRLVQQNLDRKRSAALSIVGQNFT